MQPDLSEGGAPTRALLRELKTAPQGSTFVPIHDEAGGLIGRLEPIGEALAGDPQVVDDLYRWRKAAMTAFLTVFEPTPEKTRGYLARFALGDPDRILFLIRDADGQPVGNIGLCNITSHEAEVDNVVRGEPAPPRFMRHVQAALSAWAFDRLGVERVYLNVLADNARAVQSYLKAGFREVSRVPLVREDTADGWRLTPAQDGGRAVQELVRMELAPPADRRAGMSQG